MKFISFLFYHSPRRYQTHPQPLFIYLFIYLLSYLFSFLCGGGGGRGRGCHVTLLQRNGLRLEKFQKANFVLESY